MNLDDLDSRRQELPEELRTDFDTIRRLLSAQFEALVGEVRAGHEQTIDRSAKDLGIMLQNPNHGLTPVQAKFLFACRKEGFLERVHEKGVWREKLFKCMRPDGNRLAGYVASSAMNRFAESSDA